METTHVYGDFYDLGLEHLEGEKWQNLSGDSTPAHLMEIKV